MTDDHASAAILKALATPEAVHVLDHLVREGACDAAAVQDLGLSSPKTRSTLSGLVQVGLVTCSPLSGGGEEYRLSEPLAVERLLAAARRLSGRGGGPSTTSASTPGDEPGAKAR